MNKLKLKKKNNKPSVRTANESRLAFERVLPELKKLTDRDMSKVTTDVTTGAKIVLAAERSVRAYESEIRKALPSHELKALDLLRDVGLAALYADAMAVEEKVDGKIGPLVEEANALKRSLLVDAEALANHGHLEAARIAEIRAGAGYEDLARDLIALSELFRAKWSDIEDKTLVKEAALDRAAALGTELIDALGDKHVVTPKTGDELDAFEARARAYSLMVNTYGEVREILRFVRRKEGDANEIAPSIFADRGGRPRRGATSETTPPAAPPAASEPATPASPPNG
jgi:hypothetical protein